MGRVSILAARVLEAALIWLQRPRELPLRLLQARRSPFCIKVRLVISHLALTGQVSMVDIDPWTDEAMRSANPLCKVPMLLLDDGTALHDSPVICEFLNAHAKGELIPMSGPTRWSVLRDQAVADGLAEAVIRRHVEGLNPSTNWSQNGDDDRNWRSRLPSRQLTP